MDEATNVGASRSSRAFHEFGSVPFSGRPDALFERHLLSDAVVEPSAAYDRQRFEALARSVRDLLSQRWVKTQRTYDQQNPKRVYYLSMEFLIGRSLANNVTNLMLEPLVERTPLEEKAWTGSALLEQEPDAGLGNGGLGRLAACFIDSLATLQIPAMGYGLRYEYGIFRQAIEDGWQASSRTTGCAGPTRGRSRGPSETVEVPLGCSLRAAAAAACSVIAGPARRPCSACPTTGRWSATAARRSTRCGCGARPRRTTSTSSEFSSGDFVGAVVGQHRGRDR